MTVTAERTAPAARARKPKAAAPVVVKPATKIVVALRGKGLSDVLAGVLPHASTDETLPALTTVRFLFTPYVGSSTEDSHRLPTLRVAATDRFTLGTDHAEVEPLPSIDVPGEITEPVQILLNRKDVDALVKRFRRTQFAVLITLDGIEPAEKKAYRQVATAKTITFNDYETVVTYNGHDATFPDIERLLVTDEQIAACDGVQDVSYNATYLARFAKVRIAGDIPIIRFQWIAENKPVRVTVGETFVGLVMPVRRAGS